MIKPFWCVTDFEDNFILVRIGNIYINEPIAEKNESYDDCYTENDYIIGTKSFEEGKEQWEKFNEMQFSPCPYKISNSRILQELSNRN